jgi:hypothetical protein
VESFIVLMMAFVVNIFAVIIFANFYDILSSDYVGIESAGGLIDLHFGNTVSRTCCLIA